MNKELRTIVLDKIGNELSSKGFYLADSSRVYLLFHRKSSSCIEIIQISKDKYETYLTVSASIVFLSASNELSNIDYPMFKEFSSGNIEKICVGDCREKYWIKDSFHYGDVYLEVGRGIVGVSPKKKKKPFGIKLKKYKSTTYSQLCDRIIKKLPSVYAWLEKKKQSGA